MGKREADLDKPKDTIELIAAAHKRITRKDSPIKNGSFYNADTSVDVDASILDINTMYDREKLVEFIHGLV